MKKKIIAIIPARAGSKGIPNKNIRLLSNKPMIYYSIDNAIKSNYIDDIIVSTDSEEIEVIAKQMNVKCSIRSSDLCKDDVTLDEVIYDVAKGADTDIIITMQPTSPTLKSETLDKAIEYYISNNFDTLISVHNEPHLSWHIENNTLIKNYDKRLNRQYLPANYVETGAFVITRKKFITQETRFGNNVGIFELEDNEAIDVDNFLDLKLVQTILNKEKVGIYVNGNNTRGIGHIYRALELADEFYTKPDIYYDLNQTNIEVFGQTTHNLIGINGINELYNIIQHQNYDLFINDILTTSIDYMIGLKKSIPNAKIINFEDDGEGIYVADLVINALYQNSELKQVKTGEKYYIASKLFMFYEPIKIREKVKRVFIAFGGADPQNYTDRLLNIIKNEEYKSYEFTIVLGRAKLNVQELMKYNSFSNINVLYDVKNMPELMSKCDIAVTSRGRTGYELAILGIPSIAMAQNKREEKHGFVCNENGFNYIGLNPSDNVIKANLDMYLTMTKEDRSHYQQILLKNDLRNGRKKVMNMIHEL